ncbi:MAG: hypothetical protein AAGF93_24620 [Cyanobacteria bacterium P01_H01_bin.105]
MSQPLHHAALDLETVIWPLGCHGFDGTGRYKQAGGKPYSFPPA